MLRFITMDVDDHTTIHAVREICPQGRVFTHCGFVDARYHTVHNLPLFVVADHLDRMCPVCGGQGVMKNVMTIIRAQRENHVTELCPEFGKCGKPEQTRIENCRGLYTACPRYLLKNLDATRSKKGDEMVQKAKPWWSQKIKQKAPNATPWRSVKMAREQKIVEAFNTLWDYFDVDVDRRKSQFRWVKQWETHYSLELRVHGFFYWHIDEMEQFLVVMRHLADSFDGHVTLCPEGTTKESWFSVLIEGADDSYVPPSVKRRLKEEKKT